MLLLTSEVDYNQIKKHVYAFKEILRITIFSLVLWLLRLMNCAHSASGTTKWFSIKYQDLKSKSYTNILSCTKINANKKLYLVSIFLQLRNLIIQVEGMSVQSEIYQQDSAGSISVNAGLVLFHCISFVLLLQSDNTEQTKWLMLGYYLQPIIFI